MDYVHFIAGQDDKGRRLDRILRRILPENSLSGLYKSLRNGLIKVDGKKQKPEFHYTDTQTHTRTHACTQTFRM